MTDKNGDPDCSRPFGAKKDELTIIAGGVSPKEYVRTIAAERDRLKAINQELVEALEFISSIAVPSTGDRGLIRHARHVAKYALDNTKS